MLTEDGDLMVVGGILQQHNNYDAASTVFLLHVGTEASTSAVSRQPLWLWFVIASLLLVAVIAACMLLRRHRKSTPRTEEEAQPTDSDAATSDKALMELITRYMDEQHPYLNSELKVQDVADALGTNRTYVSNCIKANRGCSFSQFVNIYRVEYAQQLLRQHPDKKNSEIWMLSGFSSESSFFRAFKTVTGMSPKEWMATKSFF